MPATSTSFDLRSVEWRRVTDPDCKAFRVDFECDDALAPADALPHDEHGGDEGATVQLSMTAPDGIPFEYFDETMQKRWTVSIAGYVESWNSGNVYGTVPDAGTAKVGA